MYAWLDVSPELSLFLFLNFNLTSLQSDMFFPIELVLSVIESLPTYKSIFNN